MALVQRSDFLDMIPAVLQAPQRSMQCTYDEPADVMYINFEPGVEATDSELVPDDIIVRYRGDEVIGLTILHASRRSRVNGKKGTARIVGVVAGAVNGDAARGCG